MHAIFLAVLASFQLLVLALPAQDGISEYQHEVARQLVGSSWNEPSYCTQTANGGGFGAVYTAMVNESSTSSFQYSSFCSQVLQSTSIAIAYTTASGIVTVTNTKTTTTAVSKTRTDPSSATTTVLCSQPKASQQCGVAANGYSNYMISQQWISAQDCNQLCLSTASCKSFQNVPNQAPNGLELDGVNLCNLYNANVATVADTYDRSVATMYDRDCPDLLPVGCAAAAAATTSAATSIITPAPSLSNAALQKREYSLPPFLSTLVYGEENIYLFLVCSCLITEGPPAVVVTQTNIVQNYTPTTTTTTQTLRYQYTDYPNMHTKYSTVS